MGNDIMLDFRLPSTRRNDQVGDAAVHTVTQALEMSTLLANRQLAISPPTGNVRTGYAPFPPSPQPTPEQRYRDVIYDSDALTVELTMMRDTRIDGINWKLSFKISGRTIMSKRQRRRIGAMLAEFVRNHRLYLGDLDLTTNVTYLQIDVRAKVGVLAEPE